jgi:hypothetical protein
MFCTISSRRGSTPHKAAMALSRSPAIYDAVDVEEEYFHAALCSAVERITYSSTGRPLTPLHNQ